MHLNVSINVNNNMIKSFDPRLRQIQSDNVTHILFLLCNHEYYCPDRSNIFATTTPFNISKIIKATSIDLPYNL